MIYDDGDEVTPADHRSLPENERDLDENPERMKLKVGLQ